MTSLLGDPLRRVLRLRGKGDGQLTRINDILTNLMEAEGRAGAGK